MIYTFKEIENEEIEKNSDVLFVTGNYPIFNHVVVDRCNELCKGNLNFDLSSFDEFNIDSEAESSDYLDLDSFLEYVKGRKMVGKWFCSIDYDNLVKKQQEKVMDYLKKSNSNGLLVIQISDWKTAKFFQKNKLIIKSTKINLIDLSWPNRKIIQNLLAKEFNTRRVLVDESAIQLFIMRMGNQYNDYSEQIDKIVLGNQGKKITYDMMSSYLSGIVNYAMDDFILSIIKPVKNNKIVLTRKSYKILKSLLDEIGAKGLVKKLQNRVDSYITYRIYINNGTIPILVPYSVEKIQEKLPDNCKIKKVSDISFKRSAKIANQTSLRDWYYIKLILDSTIGSYDEADYERALLAIIHRAAFNQDRLLNVIGIKDVIKEELYSLNIRKVAEDFYE